MRRGRTIRSALGAGPTWVRSRIAGVMWLRTCDRVGSNTRLFGRPHIQNDGRIIIGNRVRISSMWAPVEFVTGPDGLIEVGDGTFLNYGTLIDSRHQVRIGRGVMIGNYSIIADTDLPGIGDPSGAPASDSRAVEIGDGAWLAARVTVLPGTHIGAGAVIAAGSIVGGVIPPGAIAGGIPARVLRAQRAANVSQDDSARHDLEPSGRADP